MANSVVLIDPLDSVTNLPNGTPEYEKMFMFAELLGERRERSVLTLNANQGDVSLKTVLSNTNVNMMGVDFNENVSNSSKFTTKWTDSTSQNEKILDGFGISKIDVNINSSFIPTVSIEFVDIRGMTFFNLGEKSPYSLIYDFPPPIFKMTLKGYYGRALDYDLHLVKHKTRFDSKTGNYYINVDFVARTFAPLADIPFKFAEIVSLMATNTLPEPDPKIDQAAMQDNIDPINPNKLNSDPRVEPRNTYELVQKLKRLMDELKKLKNTSEESKKFDDAKLGLQNGKDVINTMNQFSGRVDVIFQNNANLILKNNGNIPEDQTSDDGGDFSIIRPENVLVYDSIIKEAADSGNNSKTEDTRMYMGILYLKSRAGNIEIPLKADATKMQDALLSYRNALLDEGKIFSRNNIVDSDIGEPIFIKDQSPPNTTDDDDYDQYNVIDVTEFYIKLRKLIKEKQDIVNESQKELVGVVNDKVEDILGFKPSIYNIFKVICDDIDNFFRVLGSVSKNAEIHHNKFFNNIIGEIQEQKSKNVTKKIYPFPLYIKEDITCGVTRKVRRMPEFKLDEPFPEVDFIEKFIDQIIAIKKEETIAEMRTNIEANGNNEWIPITPADSSLYKDLGDTYPSPYSKLEQVQGQPDSITAFYDRLLNRFYIASQFTYGDTFYSDERNPALGIVIPTGLLAPISAWFGGGGLKRDDIIKYIAKSEAINVGNSIISDAVLNSLIDKAKYGGFKGNTQLFYDTMVNVSSFSSVNGEFQTLTNGETKLYRNRDDVNFEGMSILNAPPSTMMNEDTNNPIGIFLNDTKNTFIDWMYDNDRSNIKQFTKENIPYFPDSADDFTGNLSTIYLNTINNSIIDDYIGSENSVLSFLDTVTFTDDQEKRKRNGNFGFDLAASLANYGNEIRNVLTGTTNTRTKGFLLSSMFGNSRSYFSNLKIDKDDDAISVNNCFLTPAVVEVPNFSVLYMGSLLEYNDTGLPVKSEIDALLNEEWFKALSFNGNYIKIDTDSINQLSTKDSNAFLEHLNDWITRENGGYNGYYDLILNIMNAVDDATGFDKTDNDELYDFITDYMIKNNFVQDIEENMFLTRSILNFSEYTFKNILTEDENGDPIPNPTRSYMSLKDSNDIADRKRANDIFFETFWTKLSEVLPKRKKELNEIDSGFRSAVEDEDIKTQLYYSFKNISDKWVSGIDTEKRGFPLNINDKDSLISKFAFVDRAMNPIGDDVVINVDSIIEMSQDYDLNMFQVFSRILSLNGFEFFPLQNFMVFDGEKDDGKKTGNGNDSWKNAFRIFETVEQPATPAFVCMYIGGTSSTLENVNSQYDNDGILDLEEGGLPDFINVGECDDSNEVKESAKRPTNPNEPKFKYSEPKAFRVRFGEQNQSFFTEIQLEGREFPETADSLAILSRIAGDGKTTSPVPKGQNLFSLYENRAYSVKVSMLGNVMIQPTQYFQLENIPMYSGAYMITDVKHTVKANHITTTFEGVKILKYPNPFVKSFATIVGIETGSAEDDSGSVSTTDGVILMSSSTLKNVTDADGEPNYNNSMFGLSISPN